MRFLQINVMVFLTLLACLQILKSQEKNSFVSMRKVPFTFCIRYGGITKGILRTCSWYNVKYLALSVFYVKSEEPVTLLAVQGFKILLRQQILAAGGNYVLVIRKKGGEQRYLVRQVIYVNKKEEDLVLSLVAPLIGHFYVQKVILQFWPGMFC